MNSRSNILKLFNQGFLHWFTQRTSACLLIISIITDSIDAKYQEDLKT